MPTVTQSYGSITTDSGKPKEPSILNIRHQMYVLSGYGYVLESTPSLDCVIDSDWLMRPDFILIKREDIPLLQGWATILGVEVVIVELSDDSSSLKSLYLNTRILLTYPYPKHRLASVVRRIPTQYDWNSRDKLYLISVE